jgi:Tol biopolymer transport system component
MNVLESRFTDSVLVMLICAPISAQVTQRVSVSSGGVQGNADSSDASISGDGRYVAFRSNARNLAGETNVDSDVFIRDRQTGTTEYVSVGLFGAEGNGSSIDLSVSADGRYVAFYSAADNLVPSDTNGSPDIFLRDRQSGTTELVSIDSLGLQANAESLFPSISGDGRCIAFWSYATNLVPGDTNGAADLFVRDLQAGTTERVSVDSAGAQGNAAPEGPRRPSITTDGRFVVFASRSSNLVAGDSNQSDDVFVRDRQSGQTSRVSVDSLGNQGNDVSVSPSVSADGRYVAFLSIASNLVPGDTNNFPDIFVRDRQLGTTELVSVDSGGVQGNEYSYAPSISADGRLVAFTSRSSNLVAGDTNQSDDIFIRDRQNGTTVRENLNSGGVQADLGGTWPSMSADGRYIAFESAATNLVPGDTNGSLDVFVRDPLGGPAFTSLCEPGNGGVIACPCSNPPSGPGRGCDNSSATGGAILSASGGTYVSSDSLVFTTSDENPTALSILLQGTTSLPAGIVYGQAVRCVGGSLKRLYAKNAVGGSISVPDFGAGDSAISARSAVLGDVIQSGQSRWYLVYYRVPSVLGGCPPTSTFNATPTGEVAWSP